MDSLGKLALIIILGTELTWIQNFGFSVMFSFGILTLPGILATAASALLTLFESANYSRSRRGSFGFCYICA